MVINIGKTGGARGGKCPSNIFTPNKIFGHLVKEGQIRNINVSE